MECIIKTSETFLADQESISDKELLKLLEKNGLK